MEKQSEMCKTIRAARRVGHNRSGEGGSLGAPLAPLDEQLGLSYKDAADQPPARGDLKSE